MVISNTIAEAYMTLPFMIVVFLLPRSRLQQVILISEPQTATVDQRYAMKLMFPFLRMLCKYPSQIVYKVI